ncbi:hypothetical protein AAZX31_01G123200 [Glycine max]
MDSGLAISSPKPYSVITTGSYASKASQHTKKTQIKYNLKRVQQLSLSHRYKCIEGGFAYQECNRKYVVQAVPESSFDSEPHTSNPQIILHSVKDFLATLCTLSYPYAMIGLALCALSSSLLAVEKLSDISLSFFVGVLQAAVPQLFFAIYSNALNQVSDLEIDKINKPHLPLASGQLSLKTVVIIAASFLTLSFWLSWIVGSWPLIWNLVLITSIWTAYSVNVPFLRWKKNPILAAMCMVSSWAFVLPITFFLHMQTFVLKRPIVFPRSLILAIVIMNFFFVGMALAKDIPDVEGDKIYGIDTFAIRIGQKQVFWICIFLFEMAFGVSLVAGATSSSLLVKIITGVGNAVLASVLWFQANSIDLSSKTSGGSFYMLIWKLMYASYFLVALIR